MLCAYLGQLARVRDALAAEVAVVIDDRDQTALADQGEDNGDEQSSRPVEHVKVSRKVRKRQSCDFFAHISDTSARYDFEPWIITKAKKQRYYFSVSHVTSMRADIRV